MANIAGILCCVSEPMTAVKPSISIKKSLTRPLRPIEQSSVDEEVYADAIVYLFAYLCIHLHYYEPQNFTKFNLICMQGRIYVGAGGTCPQNSLVAPRFKC